MGLPTPLQGRELSTPRLWILSESELAARSVAGVVATATEADTEIDFNLEAETKESCLNVSLCFHPILHFLVYRFTDTEALLL
jgi:hypothetical protein